MKKYVVFGAGNFGAQVIDLVGIENVKFFIDNSIEKQENGYMGLEVLSLENAKSKIEDSLIIVAISEQYMKEITKQLDVAGVPNYQSFGEFKHKLTKKKLLQRTDYIALYNKTILWIKNNSIPGEGIINNTKLQESYPEVTGYYIPTLIRWGYKDLAITYAKWLCRIQHDKGAWYDTENKEPYIFDSAQILKGLIAAHDLYPAAEEHIISGCDWILSHMMENGQLVASNKDAWGDGKTISELIHTYCISPIYEAGKMFARADYIEKANKIAEYYTSACKEQILNFGLLSHFYAYVMEAMVDIGREDLASEAMEKVAALQRENGAVPAYKDVDWVCSTGLFQLAIVWFRLGNLERGNKAFEYACKLQNESGGWYGSYLSEVNSNEVNTYFPDAEISWASKYFLDALYYKNLAQFDAQSSIFGNEIKNSDGRYRSVKETIEKKGKKDMHILDIGCGKGRYLKRLVQELPQNHYYGVDLSLNVMKYFELETVTKQQGNLTNIPFPDDFFDVAYTCEALEHAVDIDSAVKELCRVVKNEGLVIVIDKNKDKLGYFEIEEWEQWFDEKELCEKLYRYCFDVKVIKEINFDDTPANGLFYGWIGKVKKG